MKIIPFIIITAVLLAACGEQEIIDPVPAQYELKQNYPNPFVDSTTIEFGIPAVGSTGPKIVVAVHNRFSKEVAVLYMRDNHPAGNFSVTWVPTENIEPGIYYIELQIETNLFYTSRRSVARVLCVKN